MQEFEKFAIGHIGIGSLALERYSSSFKPMGMTPNIIEERTMNVAVMDVFSRLMSDRIIFMGREVDSYTANIINAQLLFLDSADANKDINIYINSPGGSVYDGMGIYDTMQYVKPDVATICTGMAASMSAVILAAGAKGKRSSLSHSRIMIHQPLGGARGQATDIAIVHNEIQKIKRELYEILAKHTGRDYNQIWADSERDCWMIAQEAKEYGLIDEVLEKKLKNNTIIP